MKNAILSMMTAAVTLSVVAQDQGFLPGNVEDAGLTRIAPDKILFDTGEDNLNNWEPFASVVGNSVFVIEANSRAQDNPDAQRFRVAFQPVGGGAVVEGEGFFGDDGTPDVDQINASRQNGNPGRVAGDRRPGAVNYIVGAEASPHVFQPFQSDNRWNLGFDRLEDGRYGTVQMFSLDANSLKPTPLSNALDAVNGRLTSGMAPGNQIGRFGGEVAVLDNGNFVVVVDDRSQVREPSNSTTAVILAPDGSVVKESWVVDPRDIWSNVASYRGGFAVRVHDTIYFHDNEGNVTGTVIHNDVLPDGVAFDTGRGDGTRIAAHINSPFVFLAGQMPLLDADGVPVEDENFLPVRVVRVAAFDSRKSGAESFVGSAIVNELSTGLGGTETQSFLPALGRVNLSSDALNRVTVAYEGTLRDEFGDLLGLPQTVVRVLAFDEANGEFSALTPSFFAFVNQNDIDIRTFRPTVAMTTKEILVAAKGEINSANKPDQGADTPVQTTFYTMFRHPDPQEDPTPPIVREPLSISIQRNGDGTLTVTFEGRLEAAPTINGPWVAVNTESPLTLTPDQPMQFGRAVR